jgi:hypothetical protein
MKPNFNLCSLKSHKGASRPNLKLTLMKYVQLQIKDSNRTQPTPPKIPQWLNSSNTGEFRTGDKISSRSVTFNHRYLVPSHDSEETRAF